MNVGLMVNEIALAANPVIGKSPLPDFSFAAKDGAKGMTISALDELHGVFDRNVMGRCQ